MHCRRSCSYDKHQPNHSAQRLLLSWTTSERKIRFQLHLFSLCQNQRKKPSHHSLSPLSPFPLRPKTRNKNLRMMICMWRTSHKLNLHKTLEMAHSSSRSTTGPHRNTLLKLTSSQADPSLQCMGSNHAPIAISCSTSGGAHLT